MNQPKPGKHDDQNAAAIEGPPKRRPYVRPAILYREPMELVAAVCQPPASGKGSAGTCPVGPISS